MLSEAGPAPTVEVQVEYDDDGLSGWVISSAGPYIPVWCQVLIDGEHRASIRADEFIPNTGWHQGGHCCLGFSYRLPAYLRDGRAHQLALVFTLSQDGATVQCGLPASVRTFGSAPVHPEWGYAICRAQDVNIGMTNAAELAAATSAGPAIAFLKAPARRVWHQRLDVDGTSLSGFPHAEFVTHPLCAALLADVYVRRSTGAVYVPGHGVWQDTCYLSNSARICEDLDFLSRGGGADVPIIEGTALLAATALNRNYFHWIMDILAGVHAYARHIGPLPPLLTPPLCSWQKDSLRLLAGGVTFAEPSDGGQPDADLVRCRRVIIPSTLGGTALFPDETVSDMIALLRDRIDHVPHATRRLFISRRDSECPRIVNEAALAAALAPLGFETLVLADCSFADQIRLFKEAEIVVGAHGAGLVNCGFCAPGTWLVEIRSTNYLNPCFYHLSSIAGLAYASHVETALPRNDGAENAASFMVDIERFTALLNRLPLGKASSPQ